MTEFKGLTLTPTLSGSDIVTYFLDWTSVTPRVCWFMKIVLQKWNYFGTKEKSCKWFTNRVAPKIDYRAVGTGYESHPTACELRPKVDVGEILRLFGCKMSARKLIELNWTHESLPTAWG